jgi:hypothetical protein
LPVITAKQLEDMSQRDIAATDGEDLADLTAVHIERDLPHNEKVLDFLGKIKNPYCFHCGDVPVRLCFSDKGPKLEEMLQDYFIRMKQG